MPDYQDLVITVRTDEQGEPKEKLEQFRLAFRELGGGQVGANFEKLFRHTGDMEKQIKQLAEGMARGAPLQAVVGFARAFGPVGLAIGGAAGVLKIAFDTLERQAQGVLNLMQAARRAMIHPAQLQAEREQARRFGVEAHEMDTMAISFSDFVAKLKTGLPEYREFLYRNLTDPADRARMTQLIEAVIREQQPIGMNLAKDFIELIEKAYTDPFRPGGPNAQAGAMLADQFATIMFGSARIRMIREPFPTVSEETKRVMDATVQASVQWVKVTAQMKSDVEAIITLITVDIMNDPVFGTIIRGLQIGLGSLREYAEESIAETGKAPFTFSELLSLPFNPVAISLFLSRYLQWAIRRKWEEQRKQGAAQPQRLLGGEIEKQADYTGALAEEFARLNRLLSGQEKPLARGNVGDLSTGKTASPAGFVNNDLSEGEFNRLFAGGKFAGQYQTVVNAAHANNLSPSLMASILAFETGYGKSRPVSEYNNPAGLMTGPQSKQFMKFDTIEEGITKAAEVQARLWRQGGETIAGMAQIYAPTKPGGGHVANDPFGANKQWPGQVAALQEQLQEKAPMTVLASNVLGDQARAADVASRTPLALMGMPQTPQMAGPTETPSERATRIFVERSITEGSPEIRPETSGRAIPSAPTFFGGVLGLTDEQYKESLKFFNPWGRGAIELADAARKLQSREFDTTMRSIRGTQAREEVGKLAQQDGGEGEGRRYGLIDTDSGALDRGLAGEAGISAIGNLNVNVRQEGGADAPDVDVSASGDGMFKGNVTTSREVVHVPPSARHVQPAVRGGE